MKAKTNLPRPIEQIKEEFNLVCSQDEKVIEQMLLYRYHTIPKKLLAQHNTNKKKLRQLDNERNYSIPFYHNVYRLHYANSYLKPVKQAHENETKV